MHTSIAEALRSRPIYEGQCSESEILYYRARAHGAVPVVAARVAGYEDPASACLELESNPLIKAAISNEKICLDSDLIITRHDIISEMWQALSMSTTANEKILALREIAKIMGFYNHVDSSKNGKVLDANFVRPEGVSELSDDERKKIAGAAMGITEAQFTVLESVRKAPNEP